MQDIDPLIFDIQPLQPKCLPGSKIEDEQNKRTNLPEQENQPAGTREPTFLSLPATLCASDREAGF